MIWPWQRERRARRAALAALGASVEDERVDPAVILAEAATAYERLGGRRSGEAAQDLRVFFPPSDVTALLSLRPPRSESYVLGAKANPRDVSISLSKRPRLWIVEFREAAPDRDAESAVLVTAHARSWLGRRGYWFARLFGYAGQVVSGAAELVGTSGGFELPLTRSRRVRAICVFKLEPEGGWSFVRAESWVSGSYRMGTSLDAAGRDHIGIRDELLLAEAAADPAGLTIPVEIAKNLPYDASAALLELAGVSDRFDGNVIEAAVRRILGLWADASEGEPDRLAAGATPDAAAQLLSPPGVVLRGPELLRVKPRRVRALRVPPEVTLELDVRAYLGVPELDDGIRRERKLWWRLAADDSAVPWRLVDADVNPFRP